MNKFLRPSALIEQLDQQHKVLRPLDSDAYHTVAMAYDTVRDKFAKAIGEHGVIHNAEGLDELCKLLDHVQRSLLSNKSEESEIRELDKQSLKEFRGVVSNARQYVRRQIERQMDWESNGNAASPFEAIENLRRVLGLDPLQQEEAKTIEEELAEIPESVRNAYRYLVEELGLDPALLTHLLCLTHPEQFSWNSGTIDSIKNWVGKCEIKAEPAIPNLPPEILISPALGWFRKIFFNELRDKYFPTYNQTGGLQKVHRELHHEIDAISKKEKERLKGKRGDDRKNIQHEFAVKRRFIRALIQYFEELENLSHPSRLKNSLGGNEPFPNRYQQAAIFETSLLGRYFNATEMGGGKTGYAIGFFEHMRDQRDEYNQPKSRKALILCPSGIVKVWQQRLSDSEDGYFRKGQAPSVAIINGDPRRRRDQLEAAKRADYVVIGIEMSRSGTEAVAHEYWLQALGADTLIIDEVHNAKNTDGKETSDTERIYRISQSPSIKYRLLLSGTPIPNHRKDIAAQLRLLHAEPEEEEKHIQSSIDVFEAFIENAPISTDDARIIAQAQPPIHTNGLGNINFHNLNHLTKMVEDCDTPVTQHYLLPYLYRIKAADCLPVQATLRPTIEDRYELSATERMHYNRILADENMGLLDKIHYLHRICLHPYGIEGVKGTGKSKLDTLQKWIDSFLDEEDHGGKIVVTSPHYKKGVTKGNHAIVDALKEKYEQQGIPVLVLDGDESGNQELKERDIDGTPMTRTKKIIAAFRDHPGQAVLLTQMDVVREGVDLSFVSRAIMLSPAWTRSEEDQFWRRFYRRGQKHDVQCVKLIAGSTIEEGINLLSQQKQELGEQLLHGRKLTADELQLLDVGSGGGKANPYMWWAMLPPKEKLNVLWGQMIHKGESYVRKTMDRLGPLFAELYNHDWETSYNGNTARLVGAMIDRLQESGQLPQTRKRKIDVADIACGAFAVERTLMDRAGLRVWSSDINPAMIGEEMGSNVLGHSYDKRRTDVAPMDNLPYEDGSKEIAVLSLGLHYSMHRSEPKDAGKERLRTIDELNRILSKDGIAILTFPPSIFRGRIHQKYEELSCAMRYFGFEVISEMTNRAQASTKGEKKFETYVFTMRKVSPPLFDIHEEWENIPEQVRKGLDLSKTRKTSGGEREKGAKKRRMRKSAEQEEGVYYDSFTLGSDRSEQMELTFESTAEQLELKRLVEEKIQILEESPEIVQTILKEYQTFDDVPLDRWLDIPLDAIGRSPSKVQDVYAQALITQETRAITKEFLSTLNEGQKEIYIEIRRRKNQKYLTVINRIDNSQRGNYLLNEYGAQ